MDPAVWMIQWNERLNVGIFEVDADHQRFILLVNDLNWAISAQQEKPEVERRLRLIIADAKTHFEHEDGLFAEHGYPGANHHAELHAEVTSRFLRVLEDFNRSEDRYRWIESGLLIKKLLVDHVLEEDMKYRDFLGSRMNRTSSS
jgi:hemerythrin